MGDKTWKKVEREKCRQLGGERSGPTGRDTPDCDDTVRIGLEIKAYKNLVFLTKDWEQADENAAKAGKIPALNVREGGRGGRDCVQMLRDDFTELWMMSGLGPIHLHQKDTERRFVRLNWSDFVRLYRAVFINNEEKPLG